MKKTARQRRVGFTLIEIMVSVSILLVLLAIGITNWQKELSQRHLDSAWREVGMLLNNARSLSISTGNAASNPGVSGGGNVNVLVDFSGSTADRLTVDLKTTPPSGLKWWESSSVPRPNTDSHQDCDLDIQMEQGTPGSAAAMPSNYGITFTNGVPTAINGATLPSAGVPIELTFVSNGVKGMLAKRIDIDTTTGSVTLNQ